MKRLTGVLAIVFGVAALAATPLVADTEVGTVTAAAAAALPGGPVLAGVSLEGVEVGTGVFIESDGSATGQLHAVLLGISPFGQPQQIVVEGTVGGGSLGGGQASFGGTATVDLGNGAAPLPAVPFSVTATADTLVLTLDGTTLPAAVPTAGAITVE
jgi:hypothetical protein